MTIAMWCIFTASLLGIVSKAPLAKAQNDTPEGYDNHLPRRQQASLSGWGARALSAHQNHFEAFPLFAAAVLVATVGGTEQALTDAMAVAWVLTRLLYLYLYLSDRSTARSVVWGISYTLSMALLSSPAWSL